MESKLKEQMILRFKKWFFSCLDFLNSIAYNDENVIYKKQLIRSSSGAYMNYRAVSRAKSVSDMINKLKIVEEELDESLAWLEILSERNQFKEIEKEYQEGLSLLKIVVSSIKTLRAKQT